MVLILSSSISAPLLFSALAIADSTTLLIISAPFFGLKLRISRALPTFFPLMRSGLK